MMFTLSKFVFLVFLFGILSITAYTYKEFQRYSIEGTATATAEKINSIARSIVTSSATSTSQEIILPSVLGTTTSFSAYVVRITKNDCTSPPCPDPGAVAFCIYTSREAAKPLEQGQPLSCRSFTFNPFRVNLYTNQGGTLATGPQLSIIPEETQNLVLLKETRCDGSDCYPVLCITGCKTSSTRGSCLDAMKGDGRGGSPNDCLG